MSGELSLLRQLRGTFAAFVVTGVIVIFVLGSRLTAARDTSQHYFLIATVVGLMFVYGLFLWMRNRAMLSTEADGETFYYLGFIFTLATLVATFMPLLWTEARADSKQVLGLFGLGLITTFVGLAGRIFYSRFSDPTDDSEAALQRVATAAEDAGRSIEAVAMQIQRAGKDLERSIGEGYERVFKTIDQHSDRLMSQLTKQLQQSSEQMTELVIAFKSRSGDIVRELEDKLQSIQLPSKETTGRLSAEIENALHRLQSFGAGLNDSALSLTKAKSQLDETSVAVGQTRAVLEVLRSSTEATVVSLDLMAKNVEQGGQTLSKFSQHLDIASRAAAEGQERISRAGGTFSETLNQAHEAIRNFVDASGSLSNQIRTLTAASAALLNAISSIASAAAEAGQASRTFSDGVTGLADAARAGSAAASGLSDKNKEAIRVFDELMTLIKEHHRELQDLLRRLTADVSASQEAVQKVHQNLISSASFVVQKLS